MWIRDSHILSQKLEGIIKGVQLVQHAIYKIENAQNGCVYIGRAKDVNQRWSTHSSELKSGKHKNCRLQEDWLQYGECVFKFEIVKVCSEDIYAYEELAAIDWERLWRGSEHVYNVPSIKDKIIFSVASWARRNCYDFRIDYKTPECKDKQPLNWNLRIEGKSNQQTVWINLASELQKENHENYQRKQQIRSEFVKSNPNYKRIEMDYFNNSEFNIESAIAFIIQQAEKWLIEQPLIEQPHASGMMKI